MKSTCKVFCFNNGIFLGALNFKETESLAAYADFSFQDARLGRARISCFTHLSVRGILAQLRRQRDFIQSSLMAR